MTSQSQQLTVPSFPALTGRNGLIDRYFYLAMSLLMATIVVWGFSHTIGAGLLHPAVPRPLILWIHAVAFSMWMAFFILQSALVRTHNVKLHRFFGWFVAGLGAVMIPLGFITNIVMTRFDNTWHVHPHFNVDAFMIIGLYDIVVFATLLVLAISWRKKSELHRRLIFLATCTLLAAAFDRFPGGFRHARFFVAVDILMLLGVVRDLLVTRRIHRVYLIALPLLALMQTFVAYTWLSHAQWWLNVAHGILG